MMHVSKSLQNEVGLTQLSLVVTGSAAALLLWSTGAVAWAGLQEHRIGHFLEATLFGGLAGFLVYGNLCYQVARLGRLQRIDIHRTVCTESQIHNAYENAPGLTMLVPSYKEEIPVIRQTLLSAALQDYPNKRVVLLLDDPPAPKTSQDRTAVWAARTLPFDLQVLLEAPFRHVSEARASFLDRRSRGTATHDEECVRLSESFGLAAEWYELQAKATPVESHTDAWFVEHILTQPAQSCRQEAARWSARRKQSTVGEKVFDEIDRAYAGLTGRFQVQFDVFERKQFCNLSHEPNKAMNLNSFIGLMGKRMKPVPRQHGVYLEETSRTIGSRLIPDTPYIITLDADSLLKPHYASTLVRMLEEPEHARVAVAQTPYSAFPNAPGVLERTAGATTDIQYLVHQGFTRFGATFWVGANALLRKSALEEICTVEREGTRIVRRYIQDRTVIEDTESTVDLLAKGWSLHNHPERLAYSATPPDFGSLVIQRARWANGGLIILPKLLSFLRCRLNSPGSMVQGLLQIHYLTSLAFAPLGVLLLLIIPFSSELMTPWMPLAAFPYFALYVRDLAATGYRPVRDLIRVYALNLLLIPVHLAGAVTSIRQAIRRTKIPFRRTPKISGRTRTSGLDLCMQLGMVVLSTALGLYYGSQMRWISGAFALANAGLLLYGINHFIGFAALKQDFLLSGKETWASLTVVRAPRQLRSWAVSSVASMKLAVLQTVRSPRQALWSLVIATEMLSPTLATGEPHDRSNQLAWYLNASPRIHCASLAALPASATDGSERRPPLGDHAKPCEPQLFTRTGRARPSGSGCTSGCSV